MFLLPAVRDISAAMSARLYVVGTLSLLDAMRKCGVSNIVFSSSCATYGIPDTIPISEGSRQSPTNPYGRTKLMIEQVLKDYGSSYGLKSVTLRYFNAAGADPGGEIGEDHDPETHLVPIVLETAAGLRKKVTVFGDDYDTPDGTCIRDFVHVADLADAHVRSIDTLNDTEPAKFYNLGSGTGVSVRGIIKTAEDVTKQQIQWEIGPRRPGDPSVLIADGSSASRELQWRPRYPDVRVMLEHAWRWLNKSSLAMRERV
jgi:UDP-glucose-4-epimerase GalE